MLPEVDVVVGIQVPVALPRDVRIVWMAEGDAEEERRVPFEAGVVVQPADGVKVTSSSNSSWFVTSATPASFTELMLWYHQSIRSPGRRSGVQPKSPG